MSGRVVYLILDATYDNESGDDDHDRRRRWEKKDHLNSELGGSSSQDTSFSQSCMSGSADVQRIFDQGDWNVLMINNHQH